MGTGEGVIGEGAVEGEDLADVDLRGDRCFVELLSGEGCGDEIALPADARDVDGGGVGRRLRAAVAASCVSAMSLVREAARASR